MSKSGHVSIWFFVGILLTIYGILIVGAGVYGLSHPPARPVVLARLHANLWWGGLLFLVGVFYTYHFAPGRLRAKGASADTE